MRYKKTQKGNSMNSEKKLSGVLNPILKLQKKNQILELKVSMHETKTLLEHWGQGRRGGGKNNLEDGDLERIHLERELRFSFLNEILQS